MHRSLDPDDWESFRALAHQMVDDMLDHVHTLPEQPAWQDYPAGAQEDLREALPEEPQGEARAYRDFLSKVLPYRSGNLHPRFFGWVQGQGFPLASMAEMLASSLNPHMGGFNQAPRDVEKQVVTWMGQLLGYPAPGLLQSGGSTANLTALAVARTAKAGFDVKRSGMKAEPLLTIYASEETHNWVMKAAGLLGFGSDAVRQIPADGEHRMQVDALATAVAADKRQGRRPIAVVATAGTVNTGATDPLNTIADLCEAEDVWMHVDGAFGALAYLSPKYRHLVGGMQRADSIAFDMHKWMYLPFEIACVLIRDAEAHKQTFSANAHYIAESKRGVIAGGLPFADHGFELTRNFKALKAWMSLKAYGSKRFAEIIERNVDQAQYLAELVQQHEDLELLAPVPMNIVCFRFNPCAREGTLESVPHLNQLNQEILLQLQERGIAVPSSTVLKGHFAIRCCVVNHRTQDSDLQALLHGVVSIGRELVLQ